MEIENNDIEIIKRKYPGIETCKCEDSYILSGEILLNHVFNNVRMTGRYNLEIIIPKDFPRTFPIVKELSNFIDEKYPHRYPDGQLCLASDLELKMFFSEDTQIASFIDMYVIPYLYTYRYYEEYGVYPFGERAHGTLGNMEYLKELFQADGWEQIVDIMLYIVQSHYRGHLLCPCGSGKRIRKCHGEVLKKVMNADLQDECKEILLSAKKEYDSRRVENGKCDQAIKTI